MRRTALFAPIRWMMASATLVLFTVGSAWAEEIAPASPIETSSETLPPLNLHKVPGLEGEPVHLSLREVVLNTLAHNLNIDIVRKDRDIAGEQVFAERGIYDPELAISSIYARTDAQTGVYPTDDRHRQIATHTSSTTTEASLTQRTPLGTILKLKAVDTRYRDIDGTTMAGSSPLGINPSYTSSVGVEVVQPLLKNFGPVVNNAQIRIAQRQLDQSNMAFRQELLDRLAEVMTAYWDLNFAIRNLDVQQQALTSAQELERVNQARVDVGSLPRLSLLQAQAQVAERESILADAESAVMAAQDRLMTLMNWDHTNGVSNWNRQIIPSDPTTYYTDLALDDAGLIAIALDARPDYQASLLDKEIAEINRDVARRQKKPELNAIAGYTLSGLEESRGDTYDTIGEGEYGGYFIGAELRYPLMNRRARAQYHQSLDRVEQAELGVESRELLITREVREATRNVRTALKQIIATNRQVDADTEKLDAEKKRLVVGERTTFDVLDFQDDLAESQARQARALADYQQALVELARSTGTLLDIQGIEIDDEEAPGGWQYTYDADSEDAVNASSVKEWDELLEAVPREEK